VKLKTGSLSIERMTLDTGRLFCGFDSGTASDGTLGYLTGASGARPRSIVRRRSRGSLASRIVTSEG
jgi:hypothetical protein